MAGTIRITSMDEFKEQSGSLELVLPSETPRPVNYWSILRWWGAQERAIYEHCARVDDTANGKSIYIASSTGFPEILIEEAGGVYSFDSDHTRNHVDRIFVTDDPALKTGDDYICPLRRGPITKVN